MPSFATTEMINPKQLTVDARHQLTEALFAVQCQIYDGADKTAFVNTVMASKAQETTIHIHKNADGDIVGFFAFHIYEKELNGRTTAIFRIQAGSLREYRGNNASTRILLNSIFRYWVKHPLRPFYYLGILIHPTSYMLCAKYGTVVWPHREQPLPPAIAAFMLELVQMFGTKAPDPQNPLIVSYGLSTRETEAERNYWRTCDKPDARFFVEQNPGYSKGDGLLTLVPLSGGHLARGAWRMISDRVHRTLAPTVTTLQQLPGLRQWLGVRDIQRRLKQTPLFAELSDADLAAAAQATEAITLPAGRYLFRAGDAGDELYVVASGSVVVVVEQGGNERIIDQIATGAMFGELAMLSGEPRSASIRTATKTTLLRLQRKVLLNLMAAHPPMHAAIWDAFTRRRFLDMTAGNTRLGALSRQQRLAWLAGGQKETLAAKAEKTVQAPWLFVPTGAVEIQQEQQWSTLRAPALIQAAGALHLVAQAPTHYVCLPEPDRYAHA